MALAAATVAIPMVVVFGATRRQMPSLGVDISAHTRDTVEAAILEVEEENGKGQTCTMNRGRTMFHQGTG
jgi:hypothetical protein